MGIADKRITDYQKEMLSETFLKDLLKKEREQKDLIIKKNYEMVRKVFYSETELIFLTHKNNIYICVYEITEINKHLNRQEHLKNDSKAHNKTLEENILYINRNKVIQQNRLCVCSYKVYKKNINNYLHIII